MMMINLKFEVFHEVLGACDLGAVAPIDSKNLGFSDLSKYAIL